MHWVYVLECDDRSWYIGETSNLEKRVLQHQAGNGSRTTSLKKEWKLIYCEGYRNKNDALGRERFLKSGSGWKFLRKQLSYYLKNE